jgi:hypothetical protein
MCHFYFKGEILLLFLRYVPCQKPFKLNFEILHFEAFTGHVEKLEIVFIILKHPKFVSEMLCQMSYLIFFISFLWHWAATQDLALARQPLFHLSHAPVVFAVGIFQIASCFNASQVGC